MWYAVQHKSNSKVGDSFIDSAGEKYLVLAVNLAGYDMIAIDDSDWIGFARQVN